MPLGVGLLGAGRVGRVHAEALRKVRSVPLVAIHDVDEDARDALCSETGARPDSLAGILAAGDIDCVIIATPTATHADMIEAAVHAGKAVLCEKPIDLDLERVRACHRSVAGKGYVQVGFNRRFDPNIVQLEKAVRDGAVGRIEALHIITRVPKPPPYRYVLESGGLFRDMTIHDIDSMRFLMGADPVSVMAVGACLVDPDLAKYDDIDSAMLTFVFADGAMAHIANSRRSAYGLDHRMEVFGSAGLVALRNGSPPDIARYDEHGTGTRGRFHPSPIYGYMESYERQLEAFFAAVDCKAPPPVTFDDAWMALAIADAAYDAKARRAEVRVIHPLAAVAA
jgi:myo-inositol 2-dehydrogenase/D-chiro-inositol 1-dehydrogenase